MKLTDLSDAILDKVFQLQQRRLREIEENGDRRYTYALNLPLVAIRENDTLLVPAGTPITAGHIVRHPDIGCLIATAVEEQAGRLAVNVLHLPDTVAFYEKRVRAVDLLGRQHYEMTATNWDRVPAKIDGDVIHLPAGYKPDLGDILLINGEYQEVKHVRGAGATVAAVTVPF